MLLVGLGVVELSRWFFVKQAVSLALLEAGRAGITDHARPASIEQAFQRALLPLFPATATQSAAQRLQQALNRRQRASGAPPWQIRLVLPSAAAFQDFASPHAVVQGAGGLAVIDNNYQAEQHQAYLERGWREGRGPLSRATIFDANSLVLNLSYMHEPLVPGMRGLLGLLAYTAQGHAHAALAGGYLPMQQTLRLTMQSHPVAWPAHSSKVVPAPHVQAAPLTPGSNGSCIGIWCSAAKLLPSYQPERPVTQPGSGSADAPGSTQTPTNPSNAGDHSNTTPAPVSPDSEAQAGHDELCGIVLCCLND